MASFLCHPLGCWTYAVPSYGPLRDDFPVKDPYPIPGPAPSPANSLGNLAQQLPPHLIRRANDHPSVLHQAAPVASSSSAPTINPSPVHVSERNPHEDVPSPDYTTNPSKDTPVSIFSQHFSCTHQIQPISKIEWEEPGFIVKRDPYEEGWFFYLKLVSSIDLINYIESASNDLLQDKHGSQVLVKGDPFCNQLAFTAFHQC
jgi:hypothetical protein